jgi:hypothetical protein
VYDVAMYISAVVELAITPFFVPVFPVAQTVVSSWVWF